MRAAPGEPYALAHDQREHMQEARKVLMAERGRAGGRNAADRKQAARTASAESISIRTVGDQFAALDFAVKGTAGGTLSAKDAAVIVAAVRCGQNLIRVEELEAQVKELTKLIKQKKRIK